MNETLSDALAFLYANCGEWCWSFTPLPQSLDETDHTREFDIRTPTAAVVVSLNVQDGRLNVRLTRTNPQRRRPPEQRKFDLRKRGWYGRFRSWTWRHLFTLATKPVTRAH